MRGSVGSRSLVSTRQFCGHVDVVHLGLDFDIANWQFLGALEVRLRDGDALIDLSTTRGEITDGGLRSNIEIGIRYMEAWLRGHGAVAIHSLMEDAATAEISRSQVWQWIHNESSTSDGRTITRERCESIVDELAAGFDLAEGNRFREAIALFREIALEETYPAFLTLAGTERYLGDGVERPTTGSIPVQDAPEDAPARLAA